MTPVNFYNQYRKIICNNLGKSGDIIKYNGNKALPIDEKMTPMLVEDLVLLNAVSARIDHASTLMVEINESIAKLSSSSS